MKISAETAAAILNAATKDTTITVMNTKIITFRTADHPEVNLNTEYSVAVMKGYDANAYYAGSLQDAQDLAAEIEYHQFEAVFG